MLIELVGIAPFLLMASLLMGFYPGERMLERARERRRRPDAATPDRRPTGGRYARAVSGDPDRRTACLARIEETASGTITPISDR